ncbi:MAG TPA: Fic family protein [Thermoanaerobaculia bacterium]|jgi:Fic family protein|nr:Fic family protein [Thermoanaerobaculia bacterium]
MPEDSTRTESPGIAKADHLYRGFPDFSVWGELSAEDGDLWSRFAASLEERKRTASPESLKNAVEVAVRAAALDTGAIEGLYNVDRGFTMTVAVQGLAWQQMVEERGAGVRELFEAQLAAYELVLDAVTQRLPITEAWIRALHETLCGPQKTYRVLTDQGWQEQELPKGQYKTRPNHVRLTDDSVHAYSPVDQVPSEMHRLIEQIRTPQFESAHPVLQASYCHYAFVSIHPFADGNGRLARALASTFFYRANSIPLVIFENQRPAYLDGLVLADRGEHGSVISFFRDRGIDTMQLVAESLMTAEAPKLENLAKRIDYDFISLRIMNKIENLFESRVSSLKMIDLSARWIGGLLELDRSFLPGYQVLPLTGIRGLAVWSNAFRDHLSEIQVSVLFATGPNPFPFVVWASASADRLEIRLEDVNPELTPHFLLRLDQWIERQLGRMLEEIAGKEDT